MVSTDSTVMMGMMAFGRGLVMGVSFFASASRAPWWSRDSAIPAQMTSTTRGSRKQGVHAPDPELLEDIGLTLYERKALVALMILGVADAASLCREGAVPTSKIYRAME